MPEQASPKALRVRHGRRSLAHLPSADLGADKENATLDSAALSAVGAHAKHGAKKSRSKSLGPGGLDALQEGTGNRGRVGLSSSMPCRTRSFNHIIALFASPQINLEAYSAFAYQ